MKEIEASFSTAKLGDFTRLNKFSRKKAPFMSHIWIKSSTFAANL